MTRNQMVRKTTRTIRTVRRIIDNPNLLFVSNIRS
jgi:hypothetical protein